MQFSENWLRTMVDPQMTSDELAHLLTMSGLEVEAVVRIKVENQPAGLLDIRRMGNGFAVGRSPLRPAQNNAAKHHPDHARRDGGRQKGSSLLH